MADPTQFRLERFVGTLVERGLYDSVVVRVAVGDDVRFEASAGTLPRGVPAKGARFDLASITKPIVAMALHRFARQESPGLFERTLGHVFGQEVGGTLREVTLDDLLRHRARLLPWVPSYALCATASQFYRRLLRGDWCPPSPGGVRRNTYSDLGYLLAGRVAERVSGLALERFVDEALLAPLRLEGVGYRPRVRGNVVACGIDTGQEARLWRSLPASVRRGGGRVRTLEAPRRGQVQDGNARFLGPSGHAGLFGSIEALDCLLAAFARGEVATRAQQRALFAGKSRYARGFERRRLKNSAGPALGGTAYGHTGFVGGSFWIDPGAGPAAKGKRYLLLGTRSSTASKLHPVRRRFHVLASAVL